MRDIRQDRAATLICALSQTAQSSNSTRPGDCDVRCGRFATSHHLPLCQLHRSDWTRKKLVAIISSAPCWTKECSLPRKTDSNNPADWLWIASSDLAGVEVLVRQEISYELCRGKLAELLEKIMKAELIRLGWFLEKTHDLERLLDALRDRGSNLLPVAEPLCDALNDA
jgi:hypothetical protein